MVPSQSPSESILLYELPVLGNGCNARSSFLQSTAFKELRCLVSKQVTVSSSVHIISRIRGQLPHHFLTTCRRKPLHVFGARVSMPWTPGSSFTYEITDSIRGILVSLCDVLALQRMLRFIQMVTRANGIFRSRCKRNYSFRLNDLRSAFLRLLNLVERPSFLWLLRWLRLGSVLFS